MPTLDYLQDALIHLVDSAVTLVVYAGAGAILLITTTKLRRHASYAGGVAATAAVDANMQVPLWFWVLDAVGVVCAFCLAFFNVVVQLMRAVVDVSLLVVSFALSVLWLSALWISRVASD